MLAILQNAAQIAENYMDILRCRVCSQGVAKSLGQLPDCGEFAGEMVVPSIKGGDLWVCNDCGSMFRYPTRSPGEYLALYEKSSCEVWVGSESQRKDFSLIYEYLQNEAGGSILDIGCYAGTFLGSIPGKFKKFGIEPSSSASDSATAKGITILGKTLVDLDAKLVFDVVVAIDVIEHVLDVESFLVDALSRVNKNGILIISTGNPECSYWRKLFKAKFWYCSYAEHLVFPSHQYFCEFSKLHNLPFPEQICFKYADLNVTASIYRLLLQIVFAFFPVMFRPLIKLRQIMEGNMTRLTADIPVGAAGIFKDHQIVIFRKRG